MPNQQQLTFAQNYWPQQAWQTNFYGVNNWSQGWDAQLWYIWYLQYYYQQYNWQWQTYWPQQNWNVGRNWCFNGWGC